MARRRGRNRLASLGQPLGAQVAVIFLELNRRELIRPSLWRSDADVGSV
jgi:hypothetical protein